ncbi:MULTISPECIES: lycopene beta-cyclase CrtY [unclassified Sphingomonas]|uniref:lycopene beta-cyclase CrtY n=1 Tax=unclassified Sphingomonas TaxID=196159 RepID=UPI001F569B5F|nr:MULTISPECIES: lycopene beta-cyclase CrtY [unclassified Sphingomonas]
MPTTLSCDLAIVGGGLAGGLIALALARKRPDLDVRLVEAGETLGGNHLWSFFSSDIAASDSWIIAPLISHGWAGYDIAFPAHRRALASAYYSIESQRLDTLVRKALPDRAILTGRRVDDVSATSVALAGGDRIEARGVIDARGPGNLARLDLGWQKFLGREMSLAEPHAAPRPMVMDATVAQVDGFRFVYCLPFAATRMFVEDTYYSDTPTLDTAALGARIDGYVQQRGWQVERILRQETGVLPVAMGGDFEGYWRSSGLNVAKVGMRAGLFHPTTGYSLPDAVRTAALIARTTDLSGANLHLLTHGFAKATWQQRGFYRMLDKMLFRAADPEERYRVLERFYRLDPQLVRRFYSGRSTMMDKARILTGKPPVPIGRALQAIGMLPAARTGGAE